MRAVHGRGDRVLVLPDLPVRGAQQHGEDRREQAWWLFDRGALADRCLDALATATIARYARRL